MFKYMTFAGVSLGLAISPVSVKAKTTSTALSPYVGYRLDNVNWKLNSGPSSKWKNLQFINYGGKGETTLKKFVIKYELGLAHLLSGRLQDTGYLRPGAPSTSSSFKGWGLAFRPNLDLGYKFNLTRMWNLTPQVGYAYDLIYINNDQTTGPFSSLTNRIQWHGPSAGFDTGAKVKKFTVNTGICYSLAFYHNNGRWKTVSPPTTKNTLSQRATGHGITSYVKLNYEVVKTISLGTDSRFYWRRAVSNGRDSRTFAAGPTAKGKFKKVNWTSFDTRLTLTKTF